MCVCVRVCVWVLVTSDCMVRVWVLVTSGCMVWCSCGLCAWRACMVLFDDLLWFYFSINGAICVMRAPFMVARALRGPSRRTPRPCASKSPQSAAPSFQALPPALQLGGPKPLSDSPTRQGGESVRKPAPRALQVSGQRRGIHPSSSAPERLASTLRLSRQSLMTMSRALLHLEELVMPY